MQTATGAPAFPSPRHGARAPSRRRRRTDRRTPARRPAGRDAPSPRPTARSNGLGHGRTAPRMSEAASSRWRLPPNTISASAIRPRATGLNASTPSSPIPTMDSQRRGAAVSAARGLAEDMRQILILGGTAEARRLAGLLAKRADLKVTLSLAGRTAQPAAQPVPVRIGGFGGTEGLIRYLNSERIDALIDATHPFAATISRHAAEGLRRGPRADPGGAPRGMDRGPGRQLDRNRGHGRSGSRARRFAAPRVPHRRPERGRGIRGGTAAPLSGPQRRSGRSSIERPGRPLRGGTRPFHGNRRENAARRASDRDDRCEKQRRRGNVRENRSRPRARQSRSSCCGRRRCPTCRPWRPSRRPQAGSIMCRRPGQIAACRPAAHGRAVRSRA